MFSHAECRPAENPDQPGGPVISREYLNLLHSLRTPAVRDLAWACFSPPLLDAAALDQGAGLGNCQLVLSPARADWLRALDREPAPLLAFLADAPGGRLGLYFERLWHFLLHHDPQVELLAHNLPVRDRERTLGEFDVIYFCKRRRQNVHLELAVKFYLRRRGADASWASWLGPNSRDRLDLKLQRMRDHQIQLADTTAGSAALADLGVHRVRREMEVKGRLYQHPAEPIALPPGAGPDTGLEHWVKFSELEALLTQQQDWAPLLRRHWLAPASPGTTPPLAVRALREWLQENLLRSRRPQQLVHYQDGREQRRLFVVPDSWPGDQACAG